MATSGRVESSVHDGHYRAYVDWEVLSQDIANNTSTVKATLYFSCDWEIDIGYRTHKIWIDGEDFTIEDTPTSGTGTWALGYGQKVIQHNSDGTKAFTISFEYDMRAQINDDYYDSISASDSWTLNTIPRASTPSLSASSFNVGDTITININRASSNFTHNLKYSFMGSSAYIQPLNVDTSVNWKAPESLASRMPNSTSGVGVITCETYNSNGDLIGTKEVSFTLNIPNTSEYQPSIQNIGCYDPTGYFADYGGNFVFSKSKIQVTVNASGIYGSTIKSYDIEANGQHYNSNNCVTDVLNAENAARVTVTVTDSRGRTASDFYVVDMLEYSNPNVIQLETSRCNADGTFNDEGAYIKVTYKATITPLNNFNSKVFRIKYKKQSESSYTTHLTYNSSYTFEGSTVFAASVDDTYSVILEAQDDFTSVTVQNDASTGFTLMDFRSTGKGVAFGKASEMDKFEVDMQTVFYQGVQTANGADLDTINTKLNEVLVHLGMS